MEAIRELATHLKRKLLVLAQDILQNGLNPSDLPFVMPLNDDRKRYIVLEGNRRLAALKSLENPEPLSGAIDNATFEEFRALVGSTSRTPLNRLSACA